MKDDAPTHVHCGWISILLVALALCWMSGPGLWASATLTQQVDPPAIHLGDTSKVTVTVTDGGWTRLVQLPKVDGLTVIRLGQEEIEGTKEHPIVISRFSVVPTSTGDFTIPPFDIKTQTNEILHFQAVTVHVLAPGQNIPPQLLAQTPNSSATSNDIPVNSGYTPPKMVIMSASPSSTPVQTTSPTTNPAADTNSTSMTTDAAIERKAVALQEYNNTSSLADVEQAAANHNPSAEYQLAIRLLEGNTARSHAAIQVLNDSLQDLNNAKPDPGSLKGGHGGWVKTFDDNDDLSEYKDDPQVQRYYEKKDAFQKAYSTVVQQEISQALPLLSDSAAQNYWKALVLLARYYEHGDALNCHVLNRKWSETVVAVDKNKAFNFAKQAADIGCPEGMDRVGLYYVTGTGATQDVEEGVKWLEQARQKNCLMAYHHLAILLITGGIDDLNVGYSKDPQRAYVLARTLEMICAQGSSGNQQGNADAKLARGFLQPDQLLSAESQAEQDAGRLHAALTGGVPEVNPKRSSNLTKGQWKAAISDLVVGGQLYCKTDRLFAVVGKPDKTQTVGDKVYLYWECSDGEIQAVCSATGYNYSGLAFGKVNDY